MIMNNDGNFLYRPLSWDVEALAQKAYDRYGELYPDVYRYYTDYQKARTLEDFGYYVMYMRESLAIDDPAIFLSFVNWTHVLLTSLHLPEDCMATGLVAFRDVLRNELSEEMNAKAGEYIEKAFDLLATTPTHIPSFIRDDNPLAASARAYLSALLATDREGARVIIIDLVQKGVPIRDLYLNIFQPVLRETGRLWQTHQASVAQEHYITGATQLIIALLYEQLMNERRRQERKGRSLVATCVSDELHEVGIRMVADFFEMDGWDTAYIGANTPTNSVVTMAKERQADAIAISSTMSFHVPRVYDLIQAIRADPVTAGACVVIGGYPFNIVPDLWKRVGADCCAHSADEAVKVVNHLVAT